MSKGMSMTQINQSEIIQTKKDKVFIGEPDYIPGRKGDGYNHLKEEKGMYKFD